MSDRETQEHAFTVYQALHSGMARLTGLKEPCDSAPAYLTWKQYTDAGSHPQNARHAKQIDQSMATTLVPGHQPIMASLLVRYIMFSQSYQKPQRFSMRASAECRTGRIIATQNSSTPVRCVTNYPAP